jgi:hypothetical protein
MSRFALPTALTVLLVSSALPARAEGDKDTKAIIAKAIQAKGGADAIEKNKGITYKFKGKFHGQGLEADMTGTFRVMQPDKQRTEAALDASGQAISYLLVYDGKKGWISINGNPEEMSNDQMTEAKEQVHLENVSDLRGLSGEGVTLTSLGESKVDGKAAVGVKVAAKGFRDVSLFFDKDTGLLLRSETKGKDPASGDEYKGVITYSDHKKVGDMTIAHKRAERRNDQAYMEMDFGTITPADKLEDKEFAKPQ